MAIFPSAALAKFQMPPQLQSNMLTALAPQQTSFAPPAPASPGPAVSDAKTSVLVKRHQKLTPRRHEN